MIKDYLSDIVGSGDCKLMHENIEYGINIYSLKPKGSAHQILFTEGMSKHLQVVNEDNAELSQIELYFYLPEYWNLELETWPIYWLNRIAQVPQKNDTWFGHGDTIPAGNPPEELSPILAANHFILARPKALVEMFNKTWDNPVNMLAVIPIFQKELDYKLRNSYSVLFDKFEKNSIDEKIDTYRTSCCRKRILGMI